MARLGLPKGARGAAEGFYRLRPTSGRALGKIGQGGGGLSRPNRARGWGRWPRLADEWGRAVSSLGAGWQAGPQAWALGCSRPAAGARDGPRPTRAMRVRWGGKDGGWACAAAGLGQNLQREGNSLSPFFIKSDLQTILQNKFLTILNPNKTWDHLELVFRLF